MSWDFVTDPQFEGELEWMRELVREEVLPLETLWLDRATFRRVIRPLQERVKERGLWAAHLDPALGGQGFGQVKLALMHEVLGTSDLAPSVFGNQAPDSGNTELLAIAPTAKIDREGAAAARTEIAMIKYHGGPVMHDVLDRAIQIHGSLGFCTDLPLEQMYRWARASSLYDGPDEVHKVTAAKRILRGYEPPEVPTEHIPTRRQRALEKYPELAGELGVEMEEQHG